MASDSTFWRSLGARFKALDVSVGKDEDIQAVLNLADDGIHHVIVECREDQIAAEHEADYTGLACEAALAAGAPNLAGALNWWIDRLCEGKKPSLKLKRLAFLSAAYCTRLANEAFAGELGAASSVGIQAVAKNRPSEAKAFDAGAAKANGQGQKRGPKPDIESAMRVYEIVSRVVPDGDWRSKLDHICEALDKAGIPSPPKWRKRDRSCNEWALYDDRANAVKAVEYRLKQAAKQRKKATSETLS